MQATAQAHAAAFAAMQFIQNKDDKMKFSLGKSQTSNFLFRNNCIYLIFYQKNFQRPLQKSSRFLI
jgi:hypothetical protein